jgi:hypothetical protein
MPGLQLVAIDNDAIAGHGIESELLDDEAKRNWILCHFCASLLATDLRK